MFSKLDYRIYFRKSVVRPKRKKLRTHEVFRGRKKDYEYLFMISGIDSSYSDTTRLLFTPYITNMANRAR